MRQRAISAAVLVPFVGIPFLLGNPWLTLAIAALAGLAGYEAAQLVRRAGLPADPGIPILLAPIAVLATLADRTLAASVAMAAVVVGVAAVASFRKTDLHDGFYGWVGGSFGALWVAGLAFVPMLMAVAPALPPSSPAHGVLDAGRTWLLCLVLTVWACDTFAYLVGRTWSWGRMAPSISPNKTWSGGLGGTIAAMIVAALLFGILGGVFMPLGALLGFIIAVASQCGDIGESLVKRAAGVKDSGSLIPGHGGALDRIDSFLFAAPALFLALVLLPFFDAAVPA
jgi:phosphatidate cytidylyltransferase